MFKWLNPSQPKKAAPLAPHPEKQLASKQARPHGFALELGAQLFAEHGLTDWKLVLDHARRRAGQCDYRAKTISLSRHYVRYAAESHIRDTILHEIAHALVGPRHGHDAVWRQQARAIGCTATRCHTLEFSAARWLMTCPDNCFEVPRHRRKANMVCAKCKKPVIYRDNHDV